MGYYKNRPQNLLVLGSEFFKKLASILAGAIAIALNKNSNKGGKVSLNTYRVFLTLQCIRSPLSFLLSAPEKRIRTDGTRLRLNVTKRPLRDEIRVFFWKNSRRKEIVFFAQYVEIKSCHSPL